MEQPWHCVECGTRLEPGHRFCPRCGAERWTPGASMTPRAPAGPRTPDGTVGLVPWVYALGALLAFIVATVSMASLIAPRGRSQLIDDMLSQGAPVRTHATLYAIFAIERVVAPIIAGVLHAIAFHGLRRLSRWGWIAAVVVAAFWSCLLAGIPFLIQLLRRDVRNAFGFS